LVASRLSFEETQTYKIRTVGAFRYLGTVVDNSARTAGEVQRRTAMATATVRQLRRVWWDTSLEQGLKALLYTALVSSVALYNAETWTIAAADWKALRRFQLNSLKEVADERRRDWQRLQRQEEPGAAEDDDANGDHDEEREDDEEDEQQEYSSRAELCRRTGIPEIETIIREKRVAWAAHAVRDKSGEGSGERIKKECSQETPWGRQLGEDLEYYGVTLEGLEEVDAATVRSMMMDARPFESTKRKRTRRTKRGATAKTVEMRAERQERLDELEEERRKKKEEAAALLRRINNKKWAKSPTAGEGKWHLVDDEEERFTVSFETFCENTGRDWLVVEGRHFYRAPDGRYECDRLRD